MWSTWTFQVEGKHIEDLLLNYQIFLVEDVKVLLLLKLVQHTVETNPHHHHHLVLVVIQGMDGY